MKYLTLLLFFLLSFPNFAQEIPPKEIQIKTALLAAPEAQRPGAKVYGYTSSGEFTTLREANNQLICIANDPNGKGFSVACYHSSAEPFMARGRALKKEGKSFQDIFDTREAEGKSGKLQLPDNGAILNVLTADLENVDWVSGEIKESYTRSVVYIPWATAESTGLPLKPAGPGLPWIMDPGTHRAHIMITPARN